MATDVVLETTMGTITLELYTAHAPLTTKNFTTLTSRSYYNNTIFHRIIPDFMIQTGDPTGTGRGGTSIYPGGKFSDELTPPPPLSSSSSSSSSSTTINLPTLKHTGAGILSMANSGPNTNGSQFFITLAPAPWLDGKHTIFGRVKGGMGVVRRIGMVKTDADDRPVGEPVKILNSWVVVTSDE